MQPKVEFVMSIETRNQVAGFIGEIPTKYGVPLLNMLDTMEQRQVAAEPAEVAAE